MTWKLTDRESNEGDFGIYENATELEAAILKNIKNDVEEEGISYEKASEYYEIIRSDDVKLHVVASNEKTIKYWDPEERRYTELNPAQ